MSEAEGTGSGSGGGDPAALAEPATPTAAPDGAAGGGTAETGGSGGAGGDGGSGAAVVEPIAWPVSVIREASPPRRSVPDVEKKG